MRKPSRGDKQLQDTSKHLTRAIDSFTGYLMSKHQCTFGGARRLTKEHMHKASVALSTLLKEISEEDPNS